jgi:hypothetical protein
MSSTLNRGCLDGAVRRVAVLDACGLAAVFSSRLDLALPQGLRWRQRLFPPLTTFWLFLLQSLSAAVSCREALMRLRAARADARLALPSMATGGYCRARKRLPLAWLDGLLPAQAAALVKEVGRAWRWHGHNVKLVDGTTLRLCDTPANQARWPQQKSQKQGCGFPLLRLVGVFSLATGAMLARAVGSIEQGERTLFKTLRSVFARGDVALFDRGFSDFATIASLHAQNVHSVTRIHQRLSVSIHDVRRIAKGDRIVRWTKTASPSCTMTEQEWDALPKHIDVRLVDVLIQIPGIRTKSMTILTTLVDEKRYTAADLAELYRRRWHIELDLRHIKTTMGFDELRARSPEMALRELAVALVAYNFLRALLAKAAAHAGLAPERFSFAAAVQALRQFAPAPGQRASRRLLNALIETLACCILPERPGRTTPRAIKRRGKQYALLNKPRHLFQETHHRSRHHAATRSKRPIARSPLRPEDAAVIINTLK